MTETEIHISPEKSLSQRLTIRSTGPGGKYFELALPREIVEREAKKRGLTVEEFREQFGVEALYDSFEGVHYRFVQKENGKPAE